MGRRTLVLIIAIVLAGVSAFAIWRYLTTIEDTVKADITEVTVYRATAFIDTGTEGTEASEFIEESTALRETVVFEESAILCLGPVERTEGEDPNEVGCPDNPRDLNALLDGKVAAGPISEGQLITSDQFVTPAELTAISLSESIPQGKVALSIRPTEVAAVGGFVRPGDRVNLVASASLSVTSFLEILKDPELRELVLGIAPTEPPPEPGVEEEPPAEPGAEEEEQDTLTQFAETQAAQVDFTQTILQDVEVMAVGADTITSPLGTGLEPQGAQVVVLELTPQQAEQVEFARQYTNVALMLLPADVPYTPFESKGVIVSDIFSLVDRLQEEFASLQEEVEAAGGTGS